MINNGQAERPFTKQRLNTLLFGSILLLIFLVSVTILGIGLIMMISKFGIKEVFAEHWLMIVLLTLAEIAIFWIGIIIVYITSAQLRIKMRLIGLLCGMIPIVHVIVLIIIMKITFTEVFFEKSKMKLNRRRHDEQICATKYPILMVHGVFFRLDEATSSIDTRTEQRIQRSFAKMMKGRTSFVVAHRLSTIKESDIILVMKDGAVIEQGNHDELIAKGGFYKELYTSQLL